MTQYEVFFDTLEKELPPVFSREEASKKTGRLLKAKTLSNLDAKGEGPGIRVKIGKKVGYEKMSFIYWLRRRAIRENLL